MTIKRSNCNDKQTHGFFKPINTLSSSDIYLSTRKRAITVESSFDIGSEQDSTESSFGDITKHNISGSEGDFEESLFYIPRTPRLTLRMRPILTSNFPPYSQDETSYRGEKIYQPQLLPHQALVDVFNHDDTVLMTPSLHPTSAVLMSPPPTPQRPFRGDDNLITCCPMELCLPILR